MKRLIFLLLITFSTHADVLIKYGGAIHNEGNELPIVYGIWLEQDNCTDCLSIFAIQKDKEQFNSQRLLGIDWSRNLLQQTNANFKVSFGFAVQEEDVGTDRLNYHIGLTLAINKFIGPLPFVVSYDHFTEAQRINGGGEPLQIISIGTRF